MAETEGTSLPIATTGGGGWMGAWSGFIDLNYNSPAKELLPVPFPM